MTARKILVPLSGRFAPDSPDSHDPAALHAAFQLGRDMQAHVQVLCVAESPQTSHKTWIDWIPDFGMNEVIDMMANESQARRDRARSAFDLAVGALSPTPPQTTDATPGFSVSFVEQVGDIRETIATCARLSDFTVMANSTERSHRAHRPILEAALRESGRPLLLVPKSASPSIGSRIVLAWDAGVESSRALAALLNFMTPGAQIHVVSVRGDAPIVPGPEEVVRYLRWHGINSEPVQLDPSTNSVTTAITNYALINDCGLLVMGTTIHSLASRLIYGNMTGAVLTNTEMPSLLVP